MNSLTSDKTALPFEYYSLPFCQPPVIVSSAENLGEVLRGDRIFNSLYQIQMRLDERCKVVCRVAGLTAEQTKAFHDAVVTADVAERVDRVESHGKVWISQADCQTRRTR